MINMISIDVEHNSDLKVCRWITPPRIMIKQDGSSIVFDKCSVESLIKALRVMHSEILTMDLINKYEKKEATDV